MGKSTTTHRPREKSRLARLADALVATEGKLDALTTAISKAQGEELRLRKSRLAGKVIGDGEILVQKTAAEEGQADLAAAKALLADLQRQMDTAAAEEVLAQEPPEGTPEKTWQPRTAAEFAAAVLAVARGESPDTYRRACRLLVRGRLSADGAAGSKGLADPEAPGMIRCMANTLCPVCQNAGEVLLETVTFQILLCSGKPCADMRAAKGQLPRPLLWAALPNWRRQDGGGLLRYTPPEGDLCAFEDRALALSRARGVDFEVAAEQLARKEAVGEQARARVEVKRAQAQAVNAELSEAEADAQAAAELEADIEAGKEAQE